MIVRDLSMIGKKIIKFESLDSTSDYLNQLHNKLEDGTLCLAFEQTKGRGRRENIWVSPKGNLYFSFIKKQVFNREDIFHETIRVSISIVELLEKYDVKAMIKYPNDILASNKKIAGILIETKGLKNVEETIVGIGININQKDFHNLNNKATSLAILKEQEYEIEEFLNEFIQIYNRIDDMLSAYNEYIQKSLIIGKDLVYKGENYKIESVLPNGDIVIKNENNNINIRSNEIDFRHLYSE
jgi:BirA family biotin operon repressor/biotin-[acetyl-CoA-carboxylase] ligase